MTIHLRRRPALLCVLALAASAAASAPAGAATARPPIAAGFSIVAVGQPSYFRFTARPGAVVTGLVRVRNLKARSLVVRLTPADLTTADSGGVSFPQSRPRTTGAWVTLQHATVRLRAHSSALVRFRARVPATITGGEHYAGIVAVDVAQARAARAPSHKRGVSVRHLTRLALPIKVTTPGPLLHHLALSGIGFGVDAAGSKLRLALRNDGSVITRATRIHLKVSRSGRTLFAVNERLADFIPQTAISFPVAWRGALKRGTYAVTGVIQPRHGPPIRVDQHITFTPKLGRQLKEQAGETTAAGDTGPPLLMWLALAGALAVATAAATGYLRLRHRVKAQARPA
ncbi:MAG: hypothetical protein QOI91_1541 [Solirubrobacteraceae bacterium]|jgi:hypothetical protein|nr:hypothetical protein [Solirubrobacteraceae bacterium]